MALFQTGTVSLFTGNALGQFNDQRLFREKWLPMYFQDDWKINSRLTVNLGLRDVWGSNPTEANNMLFQVKNSHNTTHPSGTTVPMIWDEAKSTGSFLVDGKEAPSVK